MRLEIATNFHDQWVRYQPWITLCTGATIGSPGSTPSPVRIGMSVAPNASNASCDSQTSKECRAQSADYLVASRCVELLQAELDCIRWPGVSADFGPGGVS